MHLTHPTSFASPVHHARFRACIAALLLLVAATGRAEPTHYEVRKGDTLSEIAAQHGVTTRDMALANGISVRSTLRIGQRLVLPPGAAGTQTHYTVRTGDTLDHIARRYGVELGQLITVNDIARPDRLRVGQELVIPIRGAAWDPTTSPFAPLWRRLDGTPVQPGRWRYIVIHHSASRSGSAAGMDRYHREKRHMVNGLAYHFVIGNGRGAGDGEIEVGARWTRQLNGGHLASDAQNQVSLGICLVGNFTESMPTVRQMASLRELVQYLMQRCDLTPSQVRTHREINAKPTACPGRKFPATTFVRSLQAP